MKKPYPQIKLIPAREIYLEGSDYYVGVPTRYLRKGITITHGFDKMYIPEGTKPVLQLGQEQKILGRKHHTLSYFKWTPAKRDEEKIVRMVDVFSAMPQDKINELKIKLGLIK